MRLTLFSLGLLGALLLGACGSTSRAPASEATLFHNARIYLGHPEWRTVEALLVADGRVVIAGSLAECEAADPAAARVDLGGGVAVPGLQDAHGHIEGLGKALETLDLRGVASYEALIALVAAQAATLPPGTWIEGRGWDQNLWPGQRFPEHAALSAAVPQHPVFLRRVDGHAALANSAALKAARLTQVRTVPGGEILSDIGGAPSGVLIDAAMGLVGEAIPDPDAATRERRLLLAQQALLSSGLTAVHEMGNDPWMVDTLARLRDQGRWFLRVGVYLSMGANTGASDLAGFPRAPDARDVVWSPGVKLYIDGALGSRGAALLEPYADRPSSSGLLLMEPATYARQIDLCARLGLQPATHAIGDRGNRIVLDTYARAMGEHPGFVQLLPRVEHAQVVSAADWPRFAELGVVASMQPTHCTSDMGWAVDRLGPERAAGAYAWRKLVPDVAWIAGGSDFPVERHDPLLGVYAARTRQDADGQPLDGFFADQRLDARESLALFTVGAARAAHQEDRRGRLEPGFGADLTVYDIDVLTCAPPALLTAQVQATVINGAVVYRAPANP